MIAYFARTANAAIAVDSKFQLENRDKAIAWVRSVNEKLITPLPQVPPSRI